MIVSADKIRDYIPQRSPIVMIDEILDVTDDKIITGFSIKEDNIFIEDGLFTESGIMENMAQSAASKVGYEFKIKDEPVPLGFIGAISKVKMYNRPPANTLLKTEIIFDKTVFNVSIIKAKSYLGEELLCECEMKIVVDNS